MRRVAQSGRAAGLVLSLMLLSACSGKLDANRGNFHAAIERELSQRGYECLGITRWPVELTGGEDLFLLDKSLPTAAKRMAALQAAGLVEASTVEQPVPGARGPATRSVTQFRLTDAAQPFVRDVRRHANSGFGGGPPKDLCWARRSVDRVVKWKGPLKLGDFQAADVIYTYRLIDVASWAHRHDIQQNFSEIKRALEGAHSRELTRGVLLTSEGWEAKRSLFD